MCSLYGVHDLLKAIKGCVSNVLIFEVMTFPSPLEDEWSREGVVGDVFWAVVSDCSFEVGTTRLES